MSLPQFMELYGTEEKCEAALEQVRWPKGFICPRCGEKSTAWFMDDAVSGFNVDSVDIKRASPPEQWWRPPSCRWWLGSWPSILSARPKLRFPRWPHASAWCALPNGMADSKQDHGGHVRARAGLSAAWKGSNRWCLPRRRTQWWQAWPWF